MDTPITEQADPFQVAILRGLQRKHAYQGTVPAAVKAARRKTNRAARTARRVTRRRG
jgi:hypothetical protein